MMVEVVLSRDVPWSPSARECLHYLEPGVLVGPPDLLKQPEILDRGRLFVAQPPSELVHLGTGELVHRPEPTAAHVHARTGPLGITRLTRRAGPCSWRVDGGKDGIRTHGRLATSTVFETAPFVRSGTLPRGV
jgi:hypothetical protein